jgi:sulfite reductase (NADPH) flavoprotein alpha-component
LAGATRRADYFFGPDIQRWLAEGRLASLHTAFSRVPDGGGYVQDALRRDAEHLRGAWRKVPWCVCAVAAPWHKAWPRRLTQCWHPLHLSVSQLKAKDRYAEDVF